MTNDKQHADKKEESQQAVPQNINLDDYAGDEKDDQLAQDQANRFMDDLDRGAEKHQDRAKDNTSEG
jgi:hypothetical protein